MSSTDSVGSENTSAAKKKVSPARNVVGLGVLLAVLAVGALQYSALLGYNAAVRALEARSQDEEKGLVDVAEAEKLLGKAPDGPGSDYADGGRTFTKTTYTWRGALRSYTLAAYYTKGPGPCLHHFESEGAKYEPEPAPEAPSDPGPASPGPTAPRAPKKSAAPAEGPSKAVGAADPAAGKTSAPAAETPKPTSATAPADAKGPK